MISCTQICSLYRVVLYNYCKDSCICDCDHWTLNFASVPLLIAKRHFWKHFLHAIMPLQKSPKKAIFYLQGHFYVLKKHCIVIHFFQEFSVLVACYKRYLEEGKAHHPSYCRQINACLSRHLCSKTWAGGKMKKLVSMPHNYDIVTINDAF